MDHEPEPRSSHSLLTIFLSIFLLGAIFIFLVLITNGFFLYVVLAVFLMGMLGLMHYFLWGRALMMDTAGEREEAQLREEAENTEF